MTRSSVQLKSFCKHVSSVPGPKDQVCRGSCCSEGVGFPVCKVLWLHYENCHQDVQKPLSTSYQIQSCSHRPRRPEQWCDQQDVSRPGLPSIQRDVTEHQSGEGCQPYMSTETIRRTRCPESPCCSALQDLQHRMHRGKRQVLLVCGKATGPSSLVYLHLKQNKNTHCL